MIELIESGKYSKQVIIDQHSYTDIHAFAEKAIPVTLMNVFNYQQELRKFAHTTNSVLGLYVRGEGMAPESWEGKWNDEERSLYEGYLNYLSGCKTIAKFGNHPMLLLDWGPVDCTDEVVIFEPFYENYGPDSVLSGAKPKFVKLRPPAKNGGEWTFVVPSARASIWRIRSRVSSWRSASSSSRRCESRGGSRSLQSLRSPTAVFRNKR